MADATTTPAPQGTKPPWQSKTLWTNILLAGAAFFPSIQSWLSVHADVLPMVFLVANTILRLVTKDQLSLGD